MDIDWISITPQSGAAGTSPVSFQLIAENDGFEDKTIKVRAVCGDKEAVKTLVLKGKTYPVGTVFNFDYTGTVQEVTLPPGRYKLQCWGAQGGNSGSYSGTGSKGGYSEGQLTLTEPTTLYIFVGGRGASSGYGGWNGGGGSTGSSSYNSGGTSGKSYPACGGGATDIATVTSDMSYSSKRNNRSAASLLSRCIVAGGGAGGSARYTEVTTTETISETISYSGNTTGVSSLDGYFFTYKEIECSVGYTYTMGESQNADRVWLELWKSGVWQNNASQFTISESNCTIRMSFLSTTYNTEVSGELIVSHTTTSTSTSSGSSNSSQQGGGTSGRGTSPGKQNGGGGEFGKGKNQDISNYRYASGAGGGGWYGGGSTYSDSSTSYINSSGGGSGFVNIAANAQYRPDGYTGLELDSGETKAGNVSFPSPSGGNETGHSGNGYARITVIE